MTLEEYIALRRMLNQERERDVKLDEIHRRVSNTWWKDFSSNIAGNAAWDGAKYILRLLLRK